jgi:hypothetical protein
LSRFWKEQLQLFLEREKDLSSEQRAFVHYLLTLVTPDSFAPGASKPNLCNEAKRLFPDAKQRRAFRDINLGILSTAEADVRALMLHAGNWVRGKLVAHAQVDVCICNPDSWCDGCSGTDKCTGSCEVEVPGCGCIWQLDCTKDCVPAGI